jgi:hypothetical protein
MGTLGGLAPHSAPAHPTPPLSLRSASPNPPTMLRCHEGEGRRPEGVEEGPRRSREAGRLRTRLSSPQGCLAWCASSIMRARPLGPLCQRCGSNLSIDDWIAVATTKDGDCIEPARSHQYVSAVHPVVAVASLQLHMLVALPETEALATLLNTRSLNAVDKSVVLVVLVPLSRRWAVFGRSRHPAGDTT